MSELNKELKYIKIFNDIKSNIKTYKLTEGMQLLGVRELMAHYKASYSTVMKALRQLEDENYIESIHGKGIFVKEYTASSTSTAVTSDISNHLIGLIVTDMKIPFFSKIIQVIESELVSRGYDVMIRNTDFNSVVEKDIVSTFIDRGIKGVIMVPTFDELDTDFLASVDNDVIDIVYIIRRKHNYSCNYIIPDDYNGGRAAIEHLISCGHTSIGYISGKPIRDYDQRFKAFREVLASHGIPFRQDWIVYGDQFELACGYNSMKKILSLDEKPTAIVCYTDSIAAGVIKACRESGYYVPDDISVIGYNNEDITNLVEPNITTIENPIVEICRLAVGYLIDRIERNDKGLRHTVSQTVIPTQLVEKDSVRVIK